MITALPLGLVTTRRSVPARGAANAAIGTSAWCTVTRDARLTFAMVTLFHRTCTEPHVAHFVTTSHMRCACTAGKLGGLTLDVRGFRLAREVRGIGGPFPHCRVRQTPRPEGNGGATQRREGRVVPGPVLRSYVEAERAPVGPGDGLALRDGRFQRRESSERSVPRGDLVLLVVARDTACSRAPGIGRRPRRGHLRVQRDRPRRRHGGDGRRAVDVDRRGRRNIRSRRRDPNPCSRTCRCPGSSWAACTGRHRSDCR